MVYKCFVCGKEVKDGEKFEWFGLDGSKVHKKCKPLIGKKMDIFDSMSDEEFYRYMKGDIDINIEI